MALIIKLLWRNCKSGQLWLLLMSLVVAVATISGIALFTSRIENSIRNEASQVLAGDAQIRGSTPVPDSWLDEAQTRGLHSAQATQFRAMVFSDQSNELASVKGVSPHYPLKGALMLADEPYGRAYYNQRAPAPGTAWLSSRLFALLGIAPGDAIEVGEASFTAEKALIQEPDNAQGLVGFAPRVLINRADIAATGAVQLGSRITYQLMLAGDRAQVEAYKAWVEPQLGEHHRWLDINDANQRVGRTLDKARQFLYLSGSFSVLLCAVAIALASRRYAIKQAKQVALLKTLGLGPAAIRRMYFSQLLLLGAVGTLTGCALGWAAHWGIAAALADLMPYLAPPSPPAYVMGLVTGLAALVGFAAPPLLTLQNITPARVLRAAQSHSVDRVLPTAILGLLTMTGLIGVYSGSAQLTAFIALGTFACVFATSLLARLFSRLLVYWGRRARPTTKLGLASMERHWHFNTPQIMMFAILFMLVASLLLVRTSLLQTWQQQLPPNAANHFLFNIFESEKPAIKQLLDKQGIEPNPFYPMVRGRITAVNDTEVKTLLENRDSMVNYQRELNLTWAEALGSDNKIVAGQWWEGLAASGFYASVEEQFAEGLGIEVGDTITLSAAGESLSAPVKSLRSVQWDSMNPNFYIIFNRALPNSRSANWLTSFHLPDDQKPFINELVKRYPTVTLIELDQTIEQVQSIMTKVSRAIEFIWLLVVTAGSLVLITSIQSTLDLRIKEGAIFRVIGAPRVMIRQILAIEFASIGLLAGLLACLGAETVVYLLQSYLLDLNWHWHWPLWLICPVLSTLFITLIGLASTRSVVRASPMRILRNQDD